MDPRRRQELTRYGAPAAFLAAVTIAVILIKAGLNSSGATTTVGALPTTQTATNTAPTTTRLDLTPRPGRARRRRAARSRPRRPPRSRRRRRRGSSSRPRRPPTPPPPPPPPPR